MQSMIENIEAGFFVWGVQATVSLAVRKVRERLAGRGNLTVSPEVEDEDS